MPIDIHYDKWARFENFIKFAEKKELRDRLKELDPPPITNYIDVGTIDSIHGARRKQGTKPPKAPRADENNNQEHLARIQKMKELYGMFCKMEKEEAGEEAPVNLKLPEVSQSPQRVSGYDNTLTKQFAN